MSFIDFLILQIIFLALISFFNTNKNNDENSNGNEKSKCLKCVYKEKCKRV